MSKIELVISEPVIKNWGEFEIRKTFNVTPAASGYIIQEVKRTTDIVVYETNKKPRKINTDIGVLEFTNGNVLNASGTYYEVFPIINGTTCNGKPVRSRSNCIDDQFQSGAILRYTFEADEEGEQKTWGADDYPPTSGTITMTGRCIFVPEAKKGDAKHLHALMNIESPSGTWESPDGKTWNLSKRTPANGLAFRTSYPDFPSSGAVEHTVTVTWDTTGTTTVHSSPPNAPLEGGRRRRLTRGRTASKLRYKRRIGRTRRR